VERGYPGEGKCFVEGVRFVERGYLAGGKCSGEFSAEGESEAILKKSGTHTRAYIKIQDGCNQFCSYCIIPYVRGRVRSRSAEQILKEIRGIVAAGCREIVLTGIHISSYGMDLPYGLSLIDLVEHIHEIQGLCRLRLGSLEPRIITAESAARLRSLEKLCPHFHLSLQSGCNEILKRMNRHYTTGEYCQYVEFLRGTFDRVAITTDIIVGFPGETEEEFLETYRFLEWLNPYRMHIFKYSKRQGTRAAGMKGQIPEGIKTLRSSKLISLGKRFSEEFCGYYIGKSVEVLFEGGKKIRGREYQVGYTGDYVKVALETAENLSNHIKIVNITGFLTNEIMNSITWH
jgi:threonylcarbamoyladenosine tRNA methylthiotransferase MtaB